MNKKRKIIVAVIVGLAALGGTIYHFVNEKKAYDYSGFYVVETPTQKEEIKEDEKEPEMVLSLSLLKEVNPDVAGILEFDNRAIYEPIVQAPDNEYYVRKNIDREYVAAGIPFISYDGYIYSKNVVIYGHSSTSSNIIFTPLMNYLDESYYNEHTTFTFETLGEKRTYEIFSVFVHDTKDINNSLEFTQSDWRKDAEFDVYVKQTKLRSIYETSAEVSKDDKLMTLVTCDTRNNKRRVVVVAKLVDFKEIN